MYAQDMFVCLCVQRGLVAFLLGSMTTVKELHPELKDLGMNFACK